MKKEEFKQVFDDTMNELPEELLMEEGGQEITPIREKRRKILYPVFGLVAAAVLAIGAIFAAKVLRQDEGEGTVDVITNTERPESTKNTETPPDSPAMAPVSLVTPNYPERIAFSDKDYWSGQHKEWQTRLKDKEVCQGKLTEYYQKSLKAMLQDSTKVNALCSPANVYLALAMLAECTEGETRNEILDTLGISDIGELRRISQAYFRANYLDNGQTVQRLANSAWLNSGLSYHEEVLETLRDQYFASVYQGTMGDPAYDQALQDWINQETGNSLEEMVSDLKFTKPEPGRNGVLSLVSTVYLKASWMDRFDADRNTEDIFHGVSHDSKTVFMHSDLDSVYYRGEHFTAVPQYLENGAVMWLLLPEEGLELRKLLDDPEALEFLTSDHQGAGYETHKEQMPYSIVHLSMPKFDFSADRDLIECLKEMGIGKAFSAEEADFSALIDSKDPVYVSKVQNGIRVAADEDGITAASFMMITADTGSPEGELSFTLDRPFLYAIQSDRGALLFAGFVEQF